VVAVAIGTVGDACGQEQPAVQVQQDEWTYAPQERYVEARLVFLEKAYGFALESSIDGVIESAVREVARIKIAHPGWQAESLKERLEEIATEGRTPAIRYKAFLTHALFDTPLLFEGEQFRDFRTPTELFSAVARLLETDMLARR
jgi:hypothetical protein